MTKLLIFTDVEADDFIAITILIEYYIKKKLNFDDLIICTSYGNANIKKYSLNKLFESYNIKNIKIFNGIYGIKNEYEMEGKNILSDNELLMLKKCKENEMEIINNLSFDEYYDIILLMNPCVLMCLIEKIKINKIYAMGGYYNDIISYNWSINTKASIDLINYVIKNDIIFYLFSSHMFAKCYNGYYNYKKFPNVIKRIFRNDKKSLIYIQNIIKNWNHHVIDEFPSMLQRIGEENIESQFAPADVVCMIGYLYEDIIKKINKVYLTIDEKTDKIFIENNEKSSIYVIDDIYIEKINDIIIDLL